MLLAAPANATRFVAMPMTAPKAPTLAKPLSLSLTPISILPTITAPILQETALPIVEPPTLQKQKAEKVNPLALKTTERAQEAVKPHNGSKSERMTTLFEGGKGEPVNAADSAMPEGVGDAMATQGLMLSVVAEKTGMHITVISMILNAHRDAGLSLSDWMELSKEIKETDASDAEAAQALRDELKNTVWNAPIPEAPLDPDAIMDLGMAIRSVPSQIVINRNNTFFRWKHALQADHPLARSIDFSAASSRKVGENLEITFGEIDGQKIRAQMVMSMMTEDSVSNHFDELLAAADGLDTSGLIRVARDLQAQGLIPENWDPPNK